jgi:hypothetical protein
VSNNSSILEGVFIAAIIFLPSCCLAMIGRFLQSHCLATIGEYTHRQSN